MKGDIDNKRSSTRQAGADIGRPIQSRPLLETRELSPGRVGQKEVAPPIEHRTPKKVLSIGVKILL